MPKLTLQKKRSRRSQISLAEKYQAIMEMEKGNRTQKELAEMFNVPQSTFSTWLRNAESIKQGLTKFDPKRARMRTGSFVQLETELFKWCTAMRDENVQLNGPIILQKAKELVEKLQVKNCQLSQGWFDRFKERHGISFKKS